VLLGALLGVTGCACEGALGRVAGPPAELVSAPHPARTRPAAAASAAYRMFLHTLMIPSRGVMASSCMGWYTNASGR